MVRVIFFYVTPQFPHCEVGLPVELDCEAANNVSDLRRLWKVHCLGALHRVPKDAVLHHLEIRW